MFRLDFFVGALILPRSSPPPYFTREPFEVIETLYGTPIGPIDGQMILPSFFKAATLSATDSKVPEATTPCS